MHNVFKPESLELAGKILVRIAHKVPNRLVRQTPLMVSVLKTLIRMGNTKGRMRRKIDEINHIASMLGFHPSQYDVPGIMWVQRGPHRFPLVIPTYKQQLLYHQERGDVQFVSEVLRQVDFAFRGGGVRPTRLPERALTSWLRGSLLNSPVHWYVTRSGSSEEGHALQMDFATTCDEVSHESSDCKYNVRDLVLWDDGRLDLNPLTTLDSVLKLRASEEDEDRRALRHSVFLALVLIQQANEVCYHNWVHFYFNDLVAFNIQSHFEEGHWVRRLLDPHMRYQHMLNAGGLFAPTPSGINPAEVFDDILYGGMLLSWSQSSFQENVFDKSLGYYMGADHAPACFETRHLGFNLNRSVAEPKGPMEALIVRLESIVEHFIGAIIEGCASGVDDRMMSLICENTFKFLRPDCLEGIPPEDDNPRGRFRLLITRYLLQVGLLHGLEHFSMYFWHAPLGLPQRIRKMMDLDLALDDYSYDIDKSNGYFGNEMFTKYSPNVDGQWNWGSLSYDFSDPEAQRRSVVFVEDVRAALLEYDEATLSPARDTLSEHGIPLEPELVLNPGRIGTSICM